MKLASIVALAVSLSPVLCSAQYSTLKDITLTEFTKDDLKLFKQTVNEVLSSSETTPSKSWKNPKTKSFGSVKAEALSSIKGKDCRKATIENSAGSKHEKTSYTFCLVDEKWKVLK